VALWYCVAVVNIKRVHLLLFLESRRVKISKRSLSLCFGEVGETCNFCFYTIVFPLELLLVEKFLWRWWHCVWFWWKLLAVDWCLLLTFPLCWWCCWGWPPAWWLWLCPWLPLGAPRTFMLFEFIFIELFDGLRPESLLVSTWRWMWTEPEPIWWAERKMDKKQKS